MSEEKIIALIEAALRDTAADGYKAGHRDGEHGSFDCDLPAGHFEGKAAKLYAKIRREEQNDRMNLRKK